MPPPRKPLLDRFLDRIEFTDDCSDALHSIAIFDTSASPRFDADRMQRVAREALLGMAAVGVVEPATEGTVT